MSNFKYVRDFTYNDFSAYANKRACDGNWETNLGLCVINFMASIPKGKHNKKDEYVKEHIGEVFNLEDYPNMQIDIETGEIKLDDKTTFYKVGVVEE